MIAAPPIIRSNSEIMQIIADEIRSLGDGGRKVRILEAGCGRRWGVKLGDLPYSLVGLDVDEAALAKRKSKFNDLDEVIVADIRHVELPPASFDVIYSAFVLEHISGAEAVLDRFLGWLKPGGLLILFFPDRNSVYGFITRITPLWFHVFYYKYLLGHANAGKPGFGPYETYHDEIIARRHFRSFAADRGLVVKGEFGLADELPPSQRKFTDIVARLSFGTLVSNYSNLCYVLQLPRTSDEKTTEDAGARLTEAPNEVRERASATAEFRTIE